MGFRKESQTAPCCQTLHRTAPSDLGQTCRSTLREVASQGEALDFLFGPRASRTEHQHKPLCVPWGILAVGQQESEQDEHMGVMVGKGMSEILSGRVALIPK